MGLATEMNAKAFRGPKQADLRQNQRGGFVILASSPPRKNKQETWIYWVTPFPSRGDKVKRFLLFPSLFLPVHLRRV